MLELVPDARMHDERRLLSQARLAMLSGDFPAVRQAIEGVEALRVDNTSEFVHGQAVEALVEVEEEMGDDAEALRVADAFNDKAVAWPKEYPLVRWRRQVLQRKLGVITDAQLDTARDALRAELTAVFPPRWKANAAYATWAAFDAMVTHERSAAEAVLARMPAEPPHFPEVDDLIPLELMHDAGHSADALPKLKAYCAACRVMGLAENDPLDDTLKYMHAQVVLGAAYEATGDSKGACAAYGVVTHRWKDAKPRSLTLEKAKARRDALHCAAP
jgi:serine/threonine-protein kinase